MKLPEPVHVNRTDDTGWHEITRMYWIQGHSDDVLIQIGEGYQPAQEQTTRYWTILVWQRDGFNQVFHLDRENGGSWEEVERLIDYVPGVFQSMHQKRLNS